MPKDVMVDFSEAHPKRKHRSKRDIQRNWTTRYKAFIKDGFMVNEAEWGANKGLSLKDSQVNDARRYRRDLVAMYMRRYGWTKQRAMEESAKDMKAKLESIGIYEPNILAGGSP